MMDDTHIALTKRQHTILTMVWDGLRNRTIAHELGVTVKAVEFHKARICHKWNEKNWILLCRLGVKRGYLKV